MTLNIARARFEPRHRCGPIPKERCRLGQRWGAAAAGRWQDEVGIGFPIITDPATGGSMIDVANPYMGPTDFKLDAWIPIKIGGVDLSINRAVFYLVLASALTIWALVASTAG